MIQNDLKFGEKIADAFLSHGSRGIIQKYTPQDWEQVGRGGSQIASAFAADVRCGKKRSIQQKQLSPQQPQDDAMKLFLLSS